MPDTQITILLFWFFYTKVLGRWWGLRKCYYPFSECIWCVMVVVIPTGGGYILTFQAAIKVAVH